VHVGRVLFNPPFGPPNYRRGFVLGGCLFFTVNLLDRRQSLLGD
jgi:hypothetical protein